jgi:glycosyltransferase involved in cell wall biosynthesis
LRIAIDARELAGQATGVGRYLSEILAAWDQFAGATAHEFVLCAPAPVALPQLTTLRVSSAVKPGRGTMWEQAALPRLLERVRPDVLFAPAYTAPIWSSVPTVVTIHDVSFAAHPEWFSWREGLRRRLVTRWSARRAARVITVSDFSKREIIRLLGVSSDKVDVIYSGAWRRHEGHHDPVSRKQENKEPLVLYVGSIFNRRHVPELIEGFTRLWQRFPAARLELVGDNRTHPPIDIDIHIRRSPAASRIRWRAYVSDEELASLYKEAAALAFLSEYEGFGFTPLEALAAGVPIVVLDTEIAREIHGPAAFYVSSPDPFLIEQAVERALSDDQERARVLEAAATVLQRYSWSECAHRTLQVLVASRS